MVVRVCDMKRPVSVPILAQVDQTSVCVEWTAAPLEIREKDAEGVEMKIWMDVSLTFQLQMQQVKDDDAVLEDSWCTQYCGPATHVQVKGLHPGRKYAMRVQQYPDIPDPRMEVVMAPPSDVLLFETKATCPSAMLPPTLQARNHQSLTLKWSDPEEDGGHPVSEYVLEGTWPHRVQESQVQLNSQGMFEIYRGTGRAFTWDGLAPGCRYSVRVKAVNCLGDGAFSSIASFLTQSRVPDAPSQVVCTSTSADMLTIEWPQPTMHGAESILYSIEIDDGSGRYRHVAKVNVCTLVLAKLKCDTEYKIRVCAENSEGRSDWSPEVSYKTSPALEKPCTPRNLSHRREGNASVFSWEPFNQTPGETYILEVAEVDDDQGRETAQKTARQPWKVRYKSDETEYGILTLKGDYTYACCVKSVNDAGTSGYSSPIIVDMKAISQHVKLPTIPYDLSYDEDVDTFSWKSQTRSKDEVYVFELQVGRISDVTGLKKNPWKLAYRGERSHHTGLDGLKPDAYLARVRSLYGGKFSEWTTPVKFWFANGACPDVIMHVHAVVDEDGCICVEWHPLTVQGQMVIHGREEYILESACRNEDYRQVYHGQAAHWTMRNVDLDVTYSFRVCGVNANGNGPFSEPIHVISKVIAPHAPTHLKVLYKDRHAVHLSWKLPKQRKIPVTSIHIEEIKMDHFYKASPVIHSIDPCESHQFRDLHAGTVYTFRIRAKNTHGYGPWSQSLSAETEPDVPDKPDTPKLALSGSGNVVKAIWKYPEDNGCVITDFELGLSSSCSFSQCRIVYHGPDLSCRIQDLAFNTEYFVRVRANNSSGNGTWSDTQAIRTPRPPPEPPRNVNAQMDGSVCHVSWVKSPDLETAACIGFEVEVIRYTTPENKHTRSDKKYSVIFRKSLPDRQTFYACPLSEGSLQNGEMFARIRSVGEHGVGQWSKQCSISKRSLPSQTPSNVSSSSSSSDRATLDGSERKLHDQVPAVSHSIKHRHTHFGDIKVARKPKKQKSHLPRVLFRTETFFVENGVDLRVKGIVLLFSVLLGIWINNTFLRASS